MALIVEIQNDGHIGLKQSQSSDKWGNEKDLNWYADPHHLIFPLSRFRFIYKVYSRKENVLFADMCSLVLQAFAFTLFEMGSIISITSDELKSIMQKYFKNVDFFVNDKVLRTGCQCMVQSLFAPCNVKRYAS